MAEAARDTRASVARLRPVRLGPADVTLDRKPDGTIFLRSPHALERYPGKLTERLEHWAKAAPDRVFIAQRTAAGDWRKLSYAQTLAQVRGIAQALLSRKLSTERPIAILSGNDIEHALLALAAMFVGIPYSPISVPYSLMSSDFGKLKSIVADLTPGLVFVSDGKPFARAIDAAVPLDAESRRDRQSARQSIHHDVRRSHCDRADRRGRCCARQGRSRHDCKDPVHLRLDRLSEGRHQHAAHAVLQPGDDPLGPRASSATSRRRSSTGCRGTTRSAATTTSTWCSTTAARSTSTKASRCPARSPRPRAT